MPYTSHAPHPKRSLRRTHRQEKHTSIAWHVEFGFAVERVKNGAPFAADAKATERDGEGNETTAAMAGSRRKVSEFFQLRLELRG